MAVIYPFLKRLMCAVLLVLPAYTCVAADLVDRAVLSGLASDNNNDKIEAITALGQLSNPGAAAILAALGEGKVLIATDGTVLVSVAADKALNPATGETVPPPADAQTVNMNNRLRRALQGAQASAELFSPVAATRLAAAVRLQKEADAARTPVIERALSQEKDPEIKAALNIALASSAIKSNDATVRARAVIALGQSKNPSFKPVVAALLTKDAAGTFAEPDAEVRSAAKKALDQIENHQTIVSWVGNLFYGISLGSVLLLAALGLAITFGLMGIINMAHGELLMIGAYATYLVQSFSNNICQAQWTGMLWLHYLLLS